MTQGVLETALSTRRRVENVIETLFDTAEDAVLVLDGERILGCNPAALRLFHSATKAGLIGQRPFASSPVQQADGASSAESADRRLRAALGGAPQHFVWRYRFEDQTERDVEVTMNRFYLDGSPFLLEIGHDLSEAEREVQFCARLIDSLPGSFFLYDSDLKLRRWNKTVEARSGFTADDLRGRSMADLLAAGEGRDRVVAAARRVIEHDGAVDFAEADVLLKDGTRVPSLLSAAHVDTADGPMLIGVGVDISARVEAVAELERAAAERGRLMAEAQAANNAKDQFLAVLSHELRKPLAAIQAGADLLHRLTTDEDPRALRAVDAIERNVRLQARLVNDLLDLSRLTRGKLTIVRAPIDLGEVVSSAVDTCRSDAVRAGVSLEVHAEPRIIVDADSDRIQQIVLNLVDNGIKFTPKRGRVTVSVSCRNGKGLVTVQDTGSGIERELLPAVFDVFRQGEFGTQRAPGLGIGLALVKSIADLHGGRAWAESEGRGQGSRFTVELPLSDVRTEPETPSGESKETTAPKILLIEDDLDTRELLSEALTDLGYRVLSAESAERALELLSLETVGVIVADVGLPGMDGYEFLRAARRLPSARETPAFALTGYGGESDIRRARDAGYVEHVTKPVDLATLDQRIRSCIGGANGSQR